MAILTAQDIRIKDTGVRPTLTEGCFVLLTVYNTTGTRTHAQRELLLSNCRALLIVWQILTAQDTRIKDTGVRPTLTEDCFVELSPRETLKATISYVPPSKRRFRRSTKEGEYIYTFMYLFIYLSIYISPPSKRRVRRSNAREGESIYIYIFIFIHLFTYIYIFIYVYLCLYI